MLIQSLGEKKLYKYNDIISFMEKKKEIHDKNIFMEQTVRKHVSVGKI